MTAATSGRSLGELRLALDHRGDDQHVVARQVLLARGAHVEPCRSSPRRRRAALSTRSLARARRRSACRWPGTGSPRAFLVPFGGSPSRARGAGTPWSAGRLGVVAGRTGPSRPTAPFSRLDGPSGSVTLNVLTTLAFGPCMSASIARAVGHALLQRVVAGAQLAAAPRDRGVEPRTASRCRSRPRPRAACRSGRRRRRRGSSPRPRRCGSPWNGWKVALIATARRRSARARARRGCAAGSDGAARRPGGGRWSAGRSASCGGRAAAPAGAWRRAGAAAEAAGRARGSRAPPAPASPTRRRRRPPPRRAGTPAWPAGTDPPA